MDVLKPDSQQFITSRRAMMQGIGALAGGVVATSALGGPVEAAAPVAQRSSVDGTTMTASAKFRRRMNSGETQMMALVSNIVTAKLADIAGFPLIIIGGSAIGGDKYLMGDWGMVTPGDMAEAIFRMSEVVEAPIMVDGDDGGGMGGPLNVYQAIQKYEKAGAGGVLIEDMTGLKHMGPNFPEGMILTKEAMVDNVHAAVDARKDQNFVILVRTDVMFRSPAPSARARTIADMHDRLEAYAAAGGDVIFAQGMPADEIDIAMRQTGKAIMVNGVSLGVARQKKAHILLTGDPIGAARGVMYALLTETRKTGAMPSDKFPALPADVRRQLLDLDAVEARAQKYNAYRPNRARLVP